MQHDRGQDTELLVAAKSITPHRATEDVRVREVFLLPSAQRDEYSAQFFAISSNLCKGKLARG